MPELNDEIRLEILTAIVKHAFEAIVLIDSNRQIRFWNRAAEKVFGVSTEEFPEDATVNRIVHLEPEKLDSIRTGGEQRICSSFSIRDSTIAETHIDRVVECVQIAGEPWSFVTLRNGLFKMHTDSELYWLSRTDHLSDLLNRRGFQATLEEHLDSQLAIAIIDVDFFKQINDQHGHEVGDQAIQWVAGKLQSEFPNAIGIGRLGGDEFGVLLEVESGRTMVDAFTVFCQHIETDPISWYPAGLTISVGLAISNVKGTSARELLTQADQAMYRSKRDGRNRVSVVEID